MTLPPKVTDALLTYVQHRTKIESLDILLQLAEVTGVTILGGIKKQESCGQGILPYLEAITKGTGYFKQTVKTLLDIELSDPQAATLFELGFEIAMAKAGDPYDPIEAIINFESGNHGEPREE